MKIDVPAAESYRLFDVASDLTGKGQLEAGIAEWNKVLEMDPRNAKAHNNLGVALLRQGDLAAGMAHFQQAVEIDPDYSDAQNDLGMALLREEKVDEALPHLQRAMELHPANAKIYEAYLSSPDSPVTPSPAGPRLEDAIRPQAEEMNASQQERAKLDARYRRSLNAVLVSILTPDDSAQSTARQDELPTQPYRRQQQDVLQAPSASSDFDPPSRGRPDVKELIADLNIPLLHRLAEQEQNADEKFAAQQQILRIFLHTFEASTILLEHKKNAQALTCLEIGVQAAPGNPYIVYDLARAQALNNQNKKALRTLQAAVEQGFNDADQVEGDRAFERLHNDADYQKTVAKMRDGKPNL